jgi:hypothetical protein
MRHFPLRECGYVIGCIVLLGAMYVGGYYGTIMRVATAEHYDGDDASWRLGRPFMAPRYPADRLEAFFAPIHSLDRMLRPEFWNED